MYSTHAFGGIWASNGDTQRCRFLRWGQSAHLVRIWIVDMILTVSILLVDVQNAYSEVWRPKLQKIDELIGARDELGMRGAP